MRKILLTTLLISSFIVGKGQSMYGDQVDFDVKVDYLHSFEEAMMKSKETGKLIFFNCFSDWAVPCHAMNKMVFSDKDFAEWLNKNFVNLLIDVSKPEGKYLKERYNINVMAHYLILDCNGEVVYRIVGGSKIAEFKKKLERSFSSKTSLQGTTQRYKDGDRSVKSLREYATSLLDADDSKTAQVVINDLFAELPASKWNRRENWELFAYIVKRGDYDKMEYLFEHKDDFVKYNSRDSIDKLMSAYFVNELAYYAIGSKKGDSNMLLDIFTKMQKSNIPIDDKAFQLYKFVKFRIEGKITEMIDQLEHGMSNWEDRIISQIDYSLEYLENLDERGKEEIIAYLERVAANSTGSAKNHYIRLIDKMKATEGIKFEKSSFKNALVKAKESDKPLFVDCYTTWCGPCKMMESSVFTQKEVGDFFNKHCINVKIDMEKEDGAHLFEKYGVNAFPTMLILTGDGEELLKIVGARDATALIKLVKEALIK